MNLIKSIDYFNPLEIEGRCHIIGCGSVGSTVAELLIRAGVKDISLYDFDTVSSHNIANQMFLNSDIGRLKVDALKDLLCSINPDAAQNIKKYPEGYIQDKTKLNGYIFLCVDSIELRKEIIQKNQFNPTIKAVFDFRTGLEEAQHYAADWKKPNMIKDLLDSMDFSDEEAKAAAPITACNVEMGIAPTVRVICALGVANFMNFIRKGQLKKVVLSYPFAFNSEAY